MELGSTRFIITQLIVLIHIFIFPVEFIPNNILTEKIISNANFKRIDLKVQDLEKLKWKLEL